MASDDAGNGSVAELLALQGLGPQDGYRAVHLEPDADSDVYTTLKEWLNSYFAPRGKVDVATVENASRIFDENFIFEPKALTDEVANEEMMINICKDSKEVILDPKDAANLGKALWKMAMAGPEKTAKDYLASSPYGFQQTDNAGPTTQETTSKVAGAFERAGSGAEFREKKVRDFTQSDIELFLQSEYFGSADKFLRYTDTLTPAKIATIKDKIDTGKGSKEIRQWIVDEVVSLVSADKNSKQHFATAATIAKALENHDKNV